MAATMLDQARAALQARFGAAAGSGTNSAMPKPAVKNIDISMTYKGGSGFDNCGKTDMLKRSADIPMISNGCDTQGGFGNFGTDFGERTETPTTEPTGMDRLDSFEWAPDPSRPVAREMVTADATGNQWVDDGPHEPCPKCGGRHYWRESGTKGPWFCYRCVRPLGTAWTDCCCLPPPR